MGQGITRCTNPMSSAAWGYLMFSLAQINQTCSSDHTTGVQAVAERCGMGNEMLSCAHKGHLGELMGQPNVAVSHSSPKGAGNCQHLVTLTGAVLGHLPRDTNN